MAVALDNGNGHGVGAISGGSAGATSMTIFDRIVRWFRLETRLDNGDEERYDRAEREMERRLAALEARVAVKERRERRGADGLHQ